MTQLIGMVQTWLESRRGEQGATMVEYGLMVTVVALVAVVGAGILGTNLNTLFTNIDLTP